MAEYKKYMFDNVVVGERKKKAPAATDVAEAVFFEDAAPEDTLVELEDVPVIEEPVIEVKSYTQEELDRLILDAEEKAYERGFKAAISEHEKIQTMLLDSINNRLMTLLADVNTQGSEQEQNALRFALELVKKLLPSLEKEVALTEVETFIRENFKNFAKEASLSFSFNPEMIAAIAPHISKIAERNDFEGKIAVHKDENLGLSDCKVEWNNGGVARSVSQTLSQVENLLDS